MRGRIKDTAREFILKNPIWVIYIRRNPYLHHSCWNPTSNSADPHCKECFGTGYVVRVERLPCRRVLGSKEERDIASVGYVDQAHPTFYFTEPSRPKDDDLIVEVEWNVEPRLIASSGRVVSVYRVYRIMHSVPMRQSELSFYTVGCNPTSFDEPVIFDALKQHNLITGPY